MKTIGLMLLLAGFLILNLKVLNARETIYGAADSNMKDIPTESAISRNDVFVAMVRAGTTVWDRSINTFYNAGLMMLAGGLLTTFSKTREKQRVHPTKPDAQQGSEGTSSR